MLTQTHRHKVKRRFSGKLSFVFGETAFCHRGGTEIVSDGKQVIHNHLIPYHVIVAVVCHAIRC